MSFANFRVHPGAFRRSKVFQCLVRDRLVERPDQETVVLVRVLVLALERSIEQPRMYGTIISIFQITGLVSSVRVVRIGREGLTVNLRDFNAAGRSNLQGFCAYDYEYPCEWKLFIL